MNKLIVIGLIIGCTLVGFSAGIAWQYGQSANLIKKTPERGLETAREGFLRDKVVCDEVVYTSDNGAVCGIFIRPSRIDKVMQSGVITNIKVVSLVTGIFAYVIGAVIVDLPSLTWSDVVSLSYFGIGGGLLFWLIGKTTK